MYLFFASEDFFTGVSTCFTLFYDRKFLFAVEAHKINRFSSSQRKNKFKMGVTKDNNKNDSKMPATPHLTVPTFLKSLPISANPRACGQKVAAAAPTKQYTKSVPKKTDRAFIKMATIAPPGGNKDYQAICFWLVHEDDPLKSPWQCKILMDQVIAMKEWIQNLNIHHRIFRLFLEGNQVTNNRGFAFRLYIRFIPTQLTIKELIVFAKYIAKKINMQPLVNDNQTVLVDEENFILPAHTNTVWSAVLGQEQAFKHLCFFDPTMTGPNWGPENMNTVNTYFVKKELSLDNATEMGLSNEWVKPDAFAAAAEAAAAVEAEAARVAMDDAATDALTLEALERIENKMEANKNIQATQEMGSLESEDESI
jgi:hypothetical protein